MEVLKVEEPTAADAVAQVPGKRLPKPVEVKTG